MILPGDNRITRLILENIHDKSFHPGHLRVMSESRMRFWIINCKKLAKKIGSDCVTCRKWRGKACEQFMADLPISRLAIKSDPFTNCSVDYFGPIKMKHGRRAHTKAYGAVFTCMTTRCVHLELTTDISTDCFLLAFDRFINLHGQPCEMVSDNVKNFRGASKVIKNLLNKWKEMSADREKLSSFCAQNNIKGRFVTPNDPHHNGITESIVKSIKTAFKKVIKNAVLTEEEYRTVLSKIITSINCPLLLLFELFG